MSGAVLIVLLLEVSSVDMIFFRRVAMEAGHELLVLLVRQSPRFGQRTMDGIGRHHGYRSIA
jgi:hypothetical protein